MMVVPTVPFTNRPADILFVAFFLVHIPTTVFLDSQLVFPRAWFPGVLQEMLDYHIETFQDPLVDQRPPWFTALCFFEVFFQLPYFLAAVYAFGKGCEWIHVPTILYSVQATSVMIPILYELGVAPLPLHVRLRLVGIYLPFLLVPLALLIRVLTGGPTMFTFDRIKLE